MEDEDYLGQIKPQFGRWVWPWKHMEVGQWFTVDACDRDPEDLRNMAGVRGSQLGMRFSVTKDWKPGVTRVMRKAKDAARDERTSSRAVELDYQGARQLLNRYYDASADDYGWTYLDVGGSQRANVPQIEAPPFSCYMVTIPETWKFAVELDLNGFTMTRVRMGETAESFTRKQLDAIMG